jgi:hypothetical protein
LCDVSPAFHQLVSRMEPFGQGNPEPVFASRAVRLLTPPRTIKDKHVKLKLGASANAQGRVENLPTREAAIATAADAATQPPRCHPDASSIPQRMASAVADQDPAPNWRRNVTFNAMGWRLAEAVEQQQLLPGDVLDVAFTLDVNDHPEFGGLELILRDVGRTT